MLTFEDAFKMVLEVENTAEVLDFAVPDIDVLLWPYVRYGVLRKCLATLLPEQTRFTVSIDAQSRGSKVNYALFAKTAWECFKPWPRRDIYLLNMAGSARHSYHNGALYNVYHGPYAETFPNQTLFLDSSRGPDFVSSKEYSLRRLAPVTLLSGKMTKYIPNNRYAVIVNSFMKFIKYRIETVLAINIPNTFFEKIYEKLVYFCKYMHMERKILNFLLPKEAPKWCIVHCAHYGGDGNFISMLKERGTQIAENQHGLIYNEHFAYNWAENIVADKRLQKQSPDMFLSYGDYWHKFFHAPGECCTVGNAWFTMMQDALAPCSNANAILFLLTTDYDIFFPLVEKLVQVYPKKEIILRPHPNFTRAFKQHRISHIKGIAIDTSSNIYETLNHAETVIGTASTSSYEAAAMGKRVFIVDATYTKRLPAKYFTRVSSAEELIAQLEDPWTKPDDVQDVFFNRNWKNNYREFIEK